MPSNSSRTSWRTAWPSADGRAARRSTPVHALLRAGPRGWLDLVEAQLWVLWAQVLVRLVPKGRLVSTSFTPGGATGRADFARDRKTTERVTTAISRVCRYGTLRPECLVRSIALQKMLVRHGIENSRVRLGVRSRDGVFESHAWVECGDRLVGDEPVHVRTFTPLEGLSVFGPRESS
jgi:hypothetical protein